MSESKDMNIDCFNAKFDSFGDLSNRNIYASSRFVTLDKTPFEKALSECHSPELFSDQKNTNIESDNEVKVFLAHRVVTKKCYDYFSNKYPWIFAKASHVRMLEYLALGTFIDDATKRLIINQTTLAAIEDELLALNNNRYSAKRFLNEYKTIMPKFEWTEHYTDTPRMVKDTGLDDQDNKMIQESIQDKRTAGVEKVLFRTGEAFTIKKMYEARKQIDTQFADKNAALNLHADQKKVIDYLESLNSNIFMTLLSKNIEETLKLKDQLVFDPTKPNSKPTQERILDFIMEYPKPHYHADINSKTMRVSPASDNFLGLKRELRKSLSKGCIEADLASSQFAILAMQYNSKIAAQFIKDGKKLWNELSMFIKGEEQCDAKDKIDMKTAIYSLAFGKSVNGVYDKNNKFYPGIIHILQPRNLEKMLEHEVIKDLLIQRNKWFKQIKARGGWNDYYGNFQAVTETRPVRSVAASVIQSLEFKIISGVFDVAKEYGDKKQFKIITFQHDGFLMIANDKRELKNIMKLMQDVVKKEADKWNVITHLEYKQL